MESASAWPGGISADGLPAALSDPGRLAAVRATGLLDTEPEAEFDDLAAVAAEMTGCERAFITLVDADRSFWKSCIGVDTAQTGRENSVRESFCSFVVGLGGETSPVPSHTTAAAGPAMTPLCSPSACRLAPSQLSAHAGQSPLLPTSQPLRCFRWSWREWPGKY